MCLEYKLPLARSAPVRCSVEAGRLALGTAPRSQGACPPPPSGVGAAPCVPPAHTRAEGSRAAPTPRRAGHRTLAVSCGPQALTPAWVKAAIGGRQLQCVVRWGVARPPGPHGPAPRAPGAAPPATDARQASRAPPAADPHRRSWVQPSTRHPPRGPPNAPAERRPTGTEPRMGTEPALWAVRSSGWLDVPKTAIVTTAHSHLRLTL